MISELKQQETQSNQVGIQLRFGRVERKDGAHREQKIQRSADQESEDRAPTGARSTQELSV